MARPVPVFPEVGSTIVPPGRSRPSRSAASIRATATRSLIDPPGLNASSFATSCGRRPAPIRASRTSGVSPIAVRLTVHAREQIDAFTSAVRQLPGVLMVFHLTGVTDYLIWVAAADAQDLREFVVDHLATHPAVAHAETSLIYEHHRGPGIWGAADPA